MADPLITIKQGQLKGVRDKDIDGNQILKFLDIPYAKPPIGNLRFKAPQPAEPWKGILDATKNQRRCFGVAFGINDVPPTEDALLLNIYTRQLPGPNIKPKAVMFFIHGGAFTMGSGAESNFGPQYLLTADVVLVTINYRLGIFGFLSLDDDSLDIPGNAALKDQVLALKWVKENISHFDGDPENITIFGISAGGASVQFLSISPTAKNLFHKSIIQSGSVINPWTWGQKNVIKVCENLGVSASTEKEALEVLMKASAEEVYEASLELCDVLVDCSYRRPFGPVIEKPNQSAFLIEEPLEIFRLGTFSHVPTMIGACSNEGFLYKVMLIIKGIEPPNPREFGIPWNLVLKRSCQQKKVAELISNFYFKDGVTEDAVSKLFGDGSLIHGIFESASLQLHTTKSTVYPYLFDHQSRLGKCMFSMMFEEPIQGVPHGGDTGFLFNMMNMSPELQDKDEEAIRMMVKMWTNFAKTGVPHDGWKPAEVERFRYFLIDEKPELREGYPFPESFAFWKRIVDEFGPLSFSIEVHEHPQGSSQSTSKL